MKPDNTHTQKLEERIALLQEELYEANSIISAIRDGSVDALVLHKADGPEIYSLESADYTYRILIEKFGEGALSISDNGLVLYCNDHFSKLAGIPTSKIVGTYFDSYFDTPEEFVKLKDLIAHGPSKGEVLMNFKGKRVPVYLSFTDLHPNVEAIGVVVTDLTEKRRHEQDLLRSQDRLELKVTELNQTNANLEQFIHVISHDLKEPIRKILTYTSHLTETSSVALGQKALDKLEIINSSAVRLNSLVDDLVKYAFSASDETMRKVDLNKVLSEVRDDIELIITENNATINLDPLPEILGSKVQMRQLFSNLLSNSIKYAKKDVPPVINISVEKGLISRSIHPEIKFRKISVSDNGIGMEQTHLGKIFTIFQRLHMRDEYSGNGIGLAICKKIMENHQGQIEVESTPGIGSTFNLYFPVR